MKITPTHIAALAGLSAAAFATYYISKLGVKGAAAAAGQAATDAAAGLVIGVGRSFGIPETNMTECQKAQYGGRTWDASFACSAPQFVKGLFSAPTPRVDQSILDPRDAMVRNATPAYNFDTYGDTGSFAPPAGPLNGADCSCGKSWTPEAWIGLAALGASVWIHSQNRRKHRGR